MKSQDVRDYFEENAESWLLDAYEQSGFNYPTPFHRLRILKEVLKHMADVSRVIDVGCGGGQVSIALAGEGFSVLGVDESEKMLEAAQAQLALAPVDVRRRVALERRSLQDLDDLAWDAMTVMGVVGYLPDDDALFQVANRVLRSHGYLVVSFRNRLFNIFTGSNAASRESESGQFAEVVAEAAQLCQPLSESTLIEFVQQLHSITGQLLKDGTLRVKQEESPSAKQGKSYTRSIDPRQTSPAQASETASRCGFETISFHGVHPHFATAALNQLLPPQVYNRICDSLTPFESSPMSLVWSSVFIGVFRKVG